MTFIRFLALATCAILAACSASDHDESASASEALDSPDSVRSAMKPGLVTGRIYDDLAKNVDARMDDFVALGVRILRIEIERTTPMAQYATIVRAAKKRGIEVLALVSQNSVDGSPNPMAGTREEFDRGYVPKFIAALDDTMAALPELSYVEVWNEPDVYGFKPMFTWSPKRGCGDAEGGFRYALLAKRVFETIDGRRRAGEKTPAIVAFSFSRQDDLCLRRSVIESEPIASHRRWYRPEHGLSDGLPTDIVAIHGYGKAGKLPRQKGYTYAGGTFADGVAEFLSAKFADGRPMLGELPVWYTEIGICRGSGAIAREEQAQGIIDSMRALKRHPRITAAFIYAYRDDEAGGEERCGLRESSEGGYAIKPAYAAFQSEALEKR